MSRRIPFPTAGKFQSHDAAIAHGAQTDRRGAPTSLMSGQNRRARATYPCRLRRNSRGSSPCWRTSSTRPRYPSRSTRRRPRWRALPSRWVAAIVNDVWGLQRDPAMADAVAEGGAAAVRHAQSRKRRSGARHPERHAAFFSIARSNSRQKRDPAPIFDSRSRHRLRQDQGSEFDRAAPARSFQGLWLAAACRRVTQKPVRTDPRRRRR